MQPSPTTFVFQKAALFLQLQYLENLPIITIVYISSVDGTEIASKEVLYVQPGSYSFDPLALEYFAPGSMAPGSAPSSGTISEGEEVFITFQYDPYAYLDVSFSRTTSPPFVWVRPDMHLRMPSNILFTFDPPCIFFSPLIHLLVLLMDQSCHCP